MLDLIEKGLLIGLGALTLTRERAQKIVEELVKRGEARREEASELVDRLVKRGDEERAELRKLLENTVAQMGLATKSDIEALSRRIEELAEKLGE